MKNFYGAHKDRSYFEGWYFKQQGKAGTLAFIPAFHVDAKGKKSASLQVVTESGSHLIPFRAEELHIHPSRLAIRLGGCIFAAYGCRLDVEQPGLSLRGKLHFGPLTPLRYDVMGPFRYVPFLECRHSVFSLCHRVDGWAEVNGKRFTFSGGRGYIEGDRGRSFPQWYLWSQCLGENSSIMLSVANIPVGPGHFTGILATVLSGGRQYRLATYLGARCSWVGPEGALVTQGSYKLQVSLVEGKPQALRAPTMGDMARTIQESPVCKVRYTFSKGKEVLLDVLSDKASFEWGGEKKITPY